MNALEYLKKQNVKFKRINLIEIPKTAKDVERIYGCSLHQILKTLLFIGKEPVIVVLPGDRKVDIGKLREIAKDETIRLASPDEVREITSYSIGRVSPFCIKKEIMKILDKSVFEINIINIGSGQAEIGIELYSSELKKVWDGIVGDISS